MNLITKTSHVITFTVEAFWNEEGGMGQDSFGDRCTELAAAIRLLELARVGGKLPKGVEWVIVCDVETTTTPA